MTIMDNYEMVREIGKGGMGLVSLYRHKSTKVEVAVKICTTALTEKTIKQVEREAEVLKNLEHENIITLLDFEMTDSGYFIVMPFYEEGNLDQAIEKRNGRPFDLDQVVGLFMQLCQALQYLHSRNIIHRDVKPSNLLLANDGNTVVLCDFGIMTTAMADTSASTMTKGIGTLAFGAPELFDVDDEESDDEDDSEEEAESEDEDKKEKEKYDARVDVFSAGSTLFKLTNLKAPFSGSKGAILKKMFVDKKKAKYAKFCPAEMREVIDLCMTFNFKMRPSIDLIIQKVEDKFELQLTKHEVAMLKHQVKTLTLENSKQAAKIDQLQATKHETLPPVPQRATPTSFSHQQLTKMKHKIWAVVRKGITVVNDHEVIIIGDGKNWTAGECVMVNTKTRKVTPITPPDSFIVSVAILDAGFVTGSANGTILKWDEKCNIVKQIKPTSNKMIIKLINNEVVAVTENGPLIIFDQQLNQVTKFTGTDDQPRCLDGNDAYIAFGDYDGRVRFYARHGPSEPTIYQHNDRVTAVSVVGDLVASSSADKTVQIWSMSEGKQVAQMKHDDKVWCVVLHNDMVITASLDKTVRVWKTRTGKLMHTLTHSTECRNVDISPDKTILAVAHSGDGGVQFWCMKKWNKLGEVKSGDTQDVRFLSHRELIAGNWTGEVNMITMD